MKSIILAILKFKVQPHMRCDKDFNTNKGKFHVYLKLPGNRSSLIVFALVATLGGCMSPQGSPQGIQGWVAQKAQDPVTGVSRCVVVSPDAFGSFNYTRIFAFYPIVENHPKHGLLVGVSTGGTVGVPAGDIIWRVDNNKPVRLSAASNPSSGQSYFGVDIGATLAPATVASGAKARRMLAEMKSGTNLLFRQDAPGQEIGIVRSSTYRAGEIDKGLPRPIPLDASFHAALEDCNL